MIYAEFDDIFVYFYNQFSEFFDTFDIYKIAGFSYCIIGIKDGEYYYADERKHFRPVLLGDDIKSGGIWCDIRLFPKPCVALLYTRDTIEFDDVRQFISDRYCFYKDGLPVYTDYRETVDRCLGYDLLNSNHYRNRGQLSVIRVDRKIQALIRYTYLESIQFNGNNSRGSYILTDNSKLLDKLYTQRKEKTGYVSYVDGKFKVSKDGIYRADDVNIILSTMGEDVEISANDNILTLKDRLGTVNLKPRIKKGDSNGS